MIAKKTEIKEFAASCLDKAEEAANQIHLSENAERNVKASSSPLMISNQPGFAELDYFYGMKVCAAILAVDLRKSSLKAVEIGAWKTYITMHTFLPTMAELIRRASGQIIGLRGDGLFAGFGIATWSESEHCYQPSNKEHTEKAIKQSVRTGKAMIETVDEIIQPLLKENGIVSEHHGPACIGVGIDFGEIVLTRIGLADAYEITAYGSPVNQACKLSNGNGDIRLTNQAKQAYPNTKSGRIQFGSLRDGTWRINFPEDMKMLY